MGNDERLNRFLFDNLTCYQDLLEVQVPFLYVVILYVSRWGHVLPHNMQLDGRILAWVKKTDSNGKGCCCNKNT